MSHRAPTIRVVTTPPGWPRAVPDPEDPEFPARVVGWLLELCPPDYRGHEVLRRHPKLFVYRFERGHTIPSD